MSSSRSPAQVSGRLPSADDSAAPLSYVARACLEIRSMKRPDWFLLGMGVAVLLSWLLPGPGAKGGSLHPELLNKLGVSLIFFLHGLGLSFAALGAGARNWRLHLLVQACTFVLCPLLGMLLLLAVGRHLPVDLRTGLFFLCA